MREPLGNSKTYYVTTDGVGSNEGLSPPRDETFGSVQAAFDAATPKRAGRFRRLLKRLILWALAADKPAIQDPAEFDRNAAKP